MSSKSNQFVAMLLSFRHKTRLDEYINLWLTNAELDPEFAIPQYYPILENLAGVGIAMDAFTPQFTSGSIRIINSKDSLAFQKRLTDLSHDYAIQKANVKVYVSLNSAEKYSFWENRKLIYEGEINAFSYFTRGDENSQRVQVEISKTEVEYQVTQGINRTNSELAPDNSIGKYLPLVFGEGVQVVPYSIAPDYQQGNVGFGFLYASCFRSFEPSGRKFINRGVTKYLCADLDSVTGVSKKYREVKSAPDFATPVYQQNNVSFVGFSNSKVSRKKCYPINYTPGVSNPYLITTVALVIQSDANPGTPSATGLINIRIHAEQDGMKVPRPPDEYLATATIDKAGYAAQYAAGTQFVAVACFDKPVPICSTTKGYYLSIDLTNEEDLGSYTKLSFVNYTAGTPVGAKSWETNESNNADNGGWRPATEGNVSAVFQLLGVQFVDNPEGTGIASSRGLEVSGVGMKWQDYGGTRNIFGFDQLDIILEVSGIEDTDGVITGAPGQLLTSPVDIAELLLHRYENNIWTPGLFDRTKFSDTHVVFNDTSHQYYRKVTGRTYGNATNLQVLKSIMKNTYTTLMYDGFGGNSRYGVIGVGVKRPIAGTLTDHDCQIRRFSLNSLETVVNTINLNYSRRLDNVHFQTESDQEQFGDYSRTIAYNGNDGGVGQGLSRLSLFHYGEMRLDDENFDWLMDETSATNVAKLFLKIHEHPWGLVELEAVYANVENFRLYDVIQILSTELPNPEGTAARAYPNPDECGIIGDVVKAKLYLAEIMGVGFSLTPQELPSVVFLTRLITNVNDPLLG